MILCHRVSSVVGPQFITNAFSLSNLIRFLFCLVCLKELVPVNIKSSRISEIVIINYVMT